MGQIEWCGPHSGALHLYVVHQIDGWTNEILRRDNDKMFSPSSFFGCIFRICI